MNTRPIIITSLCAILFVAAVYFGGRLQLQQERIDDTSPPTMSKTKRPVDNAPKPTASPINTPTTDTTNDQHQTSVTQHPAHTVDTPAVGVEIPETTPTEASTEQVRMSPFGLGPLPELPADFPHQLDEAQQLITQNCATRIARRAAQSEPPRDQKRTKQLQ